jgi:hypothetical protein
MVDFGWPDDIIHALDRGTARTNADSFGFEEIPSAHAVAATINAVAKYEAVRGLTRGFYGLPVPTAETALATYSQDPEGWNTAQSIGTRIYRALDKSLSPATWGACYRIISTVQPDAASDFFEEVIDGTGAPGSATRELADHYRRRPMSAVSSQDTREPMENILRAFQAYQTGRRWRRVMRPNFVMSRVK